MADLNVRLLADYLKDNPYHEDSWLAEQLNISVEEVQKLKREPVVKRVINKAKRQKKKQEKGGRPVKYTKKYRKELLKKFEEYIDEAEIPVIAEFAYLNNIPRPCLYDFPEFSTLIGKCIDKKEAQLEIKALNGEVKSSMAMFSLKQLGWSDRQRIEHSGTTITVESPPRVEVDDA